jgi:hypothetical protein
VTALASASVFLAAVVLHAAWARCAPLRNRVAQFAVCWLAGLLAMGGWLGRATGWDSLDALAGVAAYAFAGEVYVFLFTFVGSSVAAAVLLGASAPAAASPQAMVQHRLDRLVEVGWLRRDGEVFRATPSGRKIAIVYRLLRCLFRHEAVPEFNGWNRGGEAAAVRSNESSR